MWAVRRRQRAFGGSVEGLTSRYGFIVSVSQYLWCFLSGLWPSAVSDALVVLAFEIAFDSIDPSRKTSFAMDSTPLGPRHRICLISSHLIGVPAFKRTWRLAAVATQARTLPAPAFSNGRPDGPTKLEEIMDPDFKPFGDIGPKLPRVVGKL